MTAHAIELAANPRAPAGNPMLPVPYRVERVRRETYDTFTLEMVPAQAPGLAAFLPGQFNMLYAFGAGEVPISISGDPNDCPILLHTIRAVGAVTKALCALKRGDMIGLRGPFGSGWPVKQAVDQDVVILAGGIGLAPLRPALYHLLHDRRKYRRISLLYGARTPEDILYLRELERWRGQFDLEIDVTVDRGGAGWRGNVGVVTTLLPRATFDPAGTIAMLCGPEVMMRFCVLDLRKCGVPPQRIFVSVERNMQCGTGFCGHCQYGPAFICKDGPVFSFDRVEPIFGKAEV